MSTATESPEVRALWNLIHKRVGRAEFGGSLPGPGSGVHSYHQCHADVPHDDGYSVHYFGDRSRLVQPDGGHYAAALDITFHNPADMIKYTSRLHRLAVTAGPLNWSHGLREFAGTVNGEQVFAMDTTRGVRTFGWDDSHLWHIHLSFNRRLVNSGRLSKLATVFTD